MSVISEKLNIEELGVVGERASAAARAVRAAMSARNSLIWEQFVAGATQPEIAAQLGVSQPYVSKVISSQRRKSVLRATQQTVQDGTTKGEPK
ncbi:MAG: hypothetical protein KDB26_05240 [Microthrixaceae bacterium]|nr:hypothetical protein [Microthrixaceae bacterium]